MSNNNQFSISRRKVLAGLGTIGIASAGAGLGTTAFFSDEEAVSASLQAGRLDLLIDYRATYKTWLDQTRTDEIVDGPALPVPGDDMNYVVGQAPDWRDANGDVLSGEAWAAATLDIDACEYENTTDIRNELAQGQYVNGTPNDPDDSFYPGYVDGDEGLMFSLNDVKPKDEGEATISIHLCDNPAYVGVQVTSEGKENGIVEPEDAAGDVTSEMGELAHFIYVNFWLDDDCSNTYEDDETLVYQGSLAGLQAAVNAGDSDFVEGLQITDGCLDPDVHCVAFDWYFVCEPADFDKPSDAVGASTIGDEIRAALNLAPEDDIDVNVAQTDTLDFGLSFNAVQCRHNMEMCELEHGDGFGKTTFDPNPEDSLFARARFGDNGGNSTWELAVGEQPIGATNAEYTWTSGETVDWSYTYGPSSGSSFTFDGVDLSEGSTPSLGDEIVLQTKAATGSSMSVTLDEVKDAGGNVVSLSGKKTVKAEGTPEGRDLKYLKVPKCAKIDLNEGFSLSGEATVTVDTNVYSAGEEGVAFDINVE
jgi:predicted ribosomally synthesized peptide with SipW-like signal peptide